MDKEERASLEQAYLGAAYCLWLGSTVQVLQVGIANAEIMNGLKQAGLRRDGAIITPCNPRSKVLSRDLNQARLQTFRQRLQTDGISWLPAVSRDPEERWPDEPGALLIDCGPDYATALAAEFGQNALVALAPGEAPRLVWLD